MKINFNINQRITELLNQCRPAIFNIFADTQDYFAVFYGSYAWNTARISSDLDLLVVSNKLEIEKVEKLKSLIFQIHEEYNMPLDFDILYENKLHKSIDFMTPVCSGEGIYVNDTWKILPFEKKRETLNAEFFLKRFFIAMMTNPHIFIMGNYNLYNKLRIIATRNLLRAIISIEKLKKISISQIIQSFCGRGAQTGEMFIGFSHTEECYSYLTKYLGRIIPTMNAKATIEKGDIIYDFSSPDLLKPEIIL